MGNSTISMILPTFHSFPKLEMHAKLVDFNGDGS